MIDNHAGFHYLGYIVTPPLVLYVFTEGVLVHPQAPVRLRGGPAPLTAADVGWNPTRLRHADPNQLTAPMVPVGSPHFDPAHDRATVHALLNHAQPALAWREGEVAGATQLRFVGAQRVDPQQPFNLIFSEGILIQHHTDPDIVGYLPFGQGISIFQARESTDLDELQTLLRQKGPDQQERDVSDMVRGFLALGARQPVTVLLDRNHPDGPRLWNLGPGALDKFDPGLDPALDDVAALRAVMDAHHAALRTPQRIEYGYQIDQHSRWDARDAMAVIKASIYQRPERDLPARTCHGVLMPFIDSFLRHHPELQADLLGTRHVETPFAALLEQMHADTAMVRPLRLWLTDSALLAWLRDLGFQQPRFTPFQKPAVSRESLCLRHALVRLHPAGQPPGAHATLVYIDHMCHAQLDGLQLAPDAAVQRLSQQHDRLIDFIALS